MDEDKQKILSIYQQIDEAMVNKDTEALEKILDDGYILVHMTGYHQDKQEWIEQIENEEMRYFQTMPQKTSITLENNTAIVNCDTKLDARIYGFRKTWPMNMKMYLEKRRGNWIPVKTIATSR
ncbi:nuclear transport factor 2 family protein [Niallia taxi]|uniref:nuclear transport factor 2 family protein n=1 Tax=Niallia taxi TaxID=2499688 RepID=UPI002E1C7BC4|nr:nuclear transport factor 2 family protein [Niallia taxi]